MHDAAADSDARSVHGQGPGSGPGPGQNAGSDREKHAGRTAGSGQDPASDRGQGQDPAPLPAPRRGLVLLLMAGGMFMALLDIQIIASSIREIQAGLAATPEEISLVQTSYLIAEVIMIPLSGWLSRMLSTRWLYTLAVAGFTIASLACALAWNIESMVVFRALQGFLGGAMIPLAFAAGFAMYPGDREQAKVAAVLGLMATLAPALGPTVGGWVTSALSWRWLFFINILPGACLALLSPRLIHLDRPDFSLARRFDLIGAVALALFLGCLQYTLDEGPRAGWLEDALIARLLLLSIAAGVIFIARSLLHPDPLVDLRAFGDRNFTVGCLISFIIGIGMYGAIYLTPVFLGNVRGYDAFQIGTTVFITGVFQVMATFLAVGLRNYLGPKSMLVLGFCISLASFYLFSRIDSGWGGGELFLPQALRGIGTMLCIIPITGVALGGLSPAALKGASGLFNLMRNLGGAIGLAAINTALFYDRPHFHYSTLAQQMERIGLAPAPVQQRMAALVAGKLVDPDRVTLVSQKLLAQLLQREALTASFSDAYFLIGAAFFTGLLLVLLLRRS